MTRININQCQRIVIKIGSSLLINAKDNSLQQSWLKSLCKDISQLKKAGKQVMIVSSGAVSLGAHIINKPKARFKLEDKQAAAAYGQIQLVSAYQKHFKPHKIDVAQILLTLRDSEDRRHYGREDRPGRIDTVSWPASAPLSRSLGVRRSPEKRPRSL